MRITEVGTIFRAFDYCLRPIMFMLGGFKIPIQETHPWHMQIILSGVVKENDLTLVDRFDKEARFSHSAPFGLYHMPIFGGLTKYVVIEVENHSDFWHVGWKGIVNQVNKLKIYENRVKLLCGNGSYKVFGIDSSGNYLKTKIVGDGKIGDGKFEGLRLL